MKSTPILMSQDMIKAYQGGLKSMTRRARGLDKINLNPHDWEFMGIKKDLGYPASQLHTWAGFIHKDSHSPIFIKSPYGGVGDELWFRETHSYKQGDGFPNDFGVLYHADGEIGWWVDHLGIMTYPINEKTRPGIHMFKKDSRYIVPITGLRCERVQSITNDDARAEGFIPTDKGSESDNFHNLWDSINGKKYPWDKDPFVWVIEFPVKELK